MAKQESASATKLKQKKTASAAKAQEKASKKLGTLENLKSVVLRSDIPQFKAGDKIVVRSKIKEGDKERVQAFEGVVIARNGRGINETFTVRKLSAGVGVERVYPLHSPTIVGIDLKVEGFIRRAKLYYLRGLDGKKARIRDKNLKLAASLMATDAHAEKVAAASTAANTTPTSANS